MVRKFLPFVAAAFFVAGISASAWAANYGLHVRNASSAAVDVTVYQTDPATRLGSPRQYCVEAGHVAVAFLAKGSNTVDFRFHTRGCRGAVVSSRQFVVTGMTEVFTITGKNGHYEVTHDRQ